MRVILADDFTALPNIWFASLDCLVGTKAVAGFTLKEITTILANCVQSSVYTSAYLKKCL